MTTQTTGTSGDTSLLNETSLGMKKTTPIEVI
jgi:hypothetical protein